MNSFILDLQEKVTSQNCDVPTILRQAHLIASKLELKDFDQWIYYELNGYPNPGSCPDYRKVRAKLMARNSLGGLTPVVIQDIELEDAICDHRFPQSLSEIETLSRNPKDDNAILITLPGMVIQQLNNLFHIQREYLLLCSYSSVKDIIEKVKNEILDWSIKLEKGGILGEGMQFSNEEKQASKVISRDISINYVTTIVNNPSDNTQIFVDNKDVDNRNVKFAYDKAFAAISDIEDAIKRDTKIEDKDAALKMTSHIQDAIYKRKKASKIKNLMVNLKDFLLKVGSEIATKLIEDKIQGLF